MCVFLFTMQDSRNAGLSQHGKYHDMNIPIHLQQLCKIVMWLTLVILWGNL